MASSLLVLLSVRLRGAVLVCLTVACQQVTVTPEPTTCDERPVDYCARTEGGCPTGRSFAAFCAWLAARGTPREGFSSTASEELGVSGYTIWPEDGVRNDYLFDADGNVAVVFETSAEGTRCAAGPSRLPRFMLVTFTVGYGCADPFEDVSSRGAGADRRGVELIDVVLRRSSSTTTMRRRHRCVIGCSSSAVRTIAVAAPAS